MEQENKQIFEIKNETLVFIWETAKVVVISLAIILPIRYYLVQPFFVKGASMEPNFEDGDYLLIDEVSYRFRPAKRGEVIVFRYPQQPSQFFIKRVIGLPGETVRVKDDRVTIYNDENPEGLLLNESYLVSDQRTLGNAAFKLNDNEYFVLGDNRLQSSDSRRWGPVDKSLITGRAFLRPWPFTRASRVPTVIY